MEQIKEVQDKPKILIAVDTYYPKIDGTLKFVEEFVKRINNNFDYHLIVPNFQKKLSHKKTTFLDVSKFFVSSGYATIKVFSWKNIKKIKNAVKENEIIFAQGPAIISTLAIFFGKFYNKKIIYYMHVNLWEFYKDFLNNLWIKIIYKIVKPLLKISLNFCSMIIVPYQSLKEELIDRGIHPNIEIAKLGVDIDKFKPTKNKNKYKTKFHIPENKVVIGYVGRISKEKNTHLLLEAFKKLEHQQNIFLLIVGNGPEEQTKIFKEIKNCKVTGFVNNVEEYLKAIDIFIMPSLTETTSLATLEAMSSGLPVITTKVGYIKNYVLRNHNGIFFPKNSSTMLAIKIKKLMENQEFSKKLGENARKTIAYSFSWERSINKIKKLIFKEYFKN